MVWTEAATQREAVYDRNAILMTELEAWAAGTVDGGPNNDGRYPITAADGSVVMVTSQALLLAGASI